MKTETEETAIAQFIETHGITLQSVTIPARPDKSEWDKHAKHYHCTLFRGGHNTGKGPEVASMVLFYSMGSAHKTGPKCGDVLDCLAMDASCNGDTFEDFCAEFGYDEDSRKAFATWEACRDQTANLRKFLTPEQFIELMQLERL